MKKTPKAARTTRSALIRAYRAIERLDDTLCRADALSVDATRQVHALAGLLGFEFDTVFNDKTKKATIHLFRLRRAAGGAS